MVRYSLNLSLSVRFDSGAGRLAFFHMRVLYTNNPGSITLVQSLSNRTNTGQGDVGTGGEADADDRLLPGKEAKEVTTI